MIRHARLRISGLCAAAFAAAAGAQGSATTSPAAQFASAGNSGLPFSGGTGTRWQQLHGDLIGQPVVVQAVRLRRDDIPVALPTASPRQITVEIWMGEGDVAQASTDFAQNFLIGPVPVLPASPIVLPDWVAPSGGAGSFDLRVPLAVPFPFSGQNALVVEVRIVDDPQVTHLADAYAENVAARSPIDLGVGCTTGVLPFQLSASLETFWRPSLQPSLRWGLRALFAPIGQPGFFVLGGPAGPVTVPGLCAPVFPTLDLVVPGVSISVPPFAVLTAAEVESPFDPSFVGVDVFVQAGAIDLKQPGPPFVLSQGQRLTVAPLPPLPQPIVSLEGTVADPVATSIAYGGRVLQFEF